MRILYAIQGTGNGHLSRARDIIPLLRQRCETDILISGTQADVSIPFEADYRLKGLSFIFGKKGGVDVWNTYVKANMKRLRDEINSIPIKKYDFVINDFEPVSAWACLLKKVPCISLSHQGALLDKNVPKPTGNDVFGKFILRNYAPSQKRIGLHFCKYGKNIYTPVIRKEVRELKTVDKGHYTVYLPAYDDKQLIESLRHFEGVRWQIFSKHNKKVVIDENIEIYPISNDAFRSSMASATGVLCGAGFETPAETMFLGKKLMVIPMKSQYEQKYNAAALKSMGVPVIPKLKPKHFELIHDWIDSDYKIEISYPDITSKIINEIFETHVHDIMKKNLWEKDYQLSIPKNEMKEIIKTKHTFI